MYICTYVWDYKFELRVSEVDEDQGDQKLRIQVCSLAIIQSYLDE